MNISLITASQITGVLAILIALTNIIVQVIKKVTWDKIDTNILAVIVGVVLSVAGLVAYFQYKCWVMEWYTVAAFVIIGILVSYGAMFGYDKLLSKLNIASDE